MAPLKDTDIRDAFLEALGPLKRRNFVDWKPLASEWLVKNLEGSSQLDFARLMYEHVSNGNEIDQVVETRDPWRHSHDFHYDFRFSIDGQKIYIESLLDQRSPGPVLQIVNMKNA